MHLIVKAFGSHCRVGRVHPSSAAIAAAAISGIDRLQTLGRDSFYLVPGEKGPCGWLSEALGVAVLLEERPDGGFPDGRDAPAPRSSRRRVSRKWPAGLASISPRPAAGFGRISRSAAATPSGKTRSRARRGRFSIPHWPTYRPISRLIPTPICRRPSLGNSRSARPGFGRQASANGAWCRAAIASRGPSRTTSATRSRPAGAGGMRPDASLPASGEYGHRPLDRRNPARAGRPLGSVFPACFRRFGEERWFALPLSAL